MSTGCRPTLNGTINVTCVRADHCENFVQGSLGRKPVPVLHVYFPALTDERTGEPWWGMYVLDGSIARPAALKQAPFLEPDHNGNVLALISPATGWGIISFRIFKHPNCFIIGTELAATSCKCLLYSRRNYNELGYLIWRHSFLEKQKIPPPAVQHVFYSFRVTPSSLH